MASVRHLLHRLGVSPGPRRVDWLRSLMHGGWFAEEISDDRRAYLHAPCDQPRGRPDDRRAYLHAPLRATKRASRDPLAAARRPVAASCGPRSSEGQPVGWCRRRDRRGRSLEAERQILRPHEASANSVVSSGFVPGIERTMGMSRSRTRRETRVRVGGCCLPIPLGLLAAVGAAALAGRRAQRREAARRPHIA